MSNTSNIEQMYDYLVTKPEAGTVRAIGRGSMPTLEGENPIAVAQRAYDKLAEYGGDGTFRFAPGRWVVDRPFRHYQHRTVLAAPGAVFTPASGYEGFIFDVRPMGEGPRDPPPEDRFSDWSVDETVTGPSGQPEHMGLRDIAIDGDDRCKGIRLADLKHSWFENLFVVRARGGPGLELAGSVRESVVRNLQLFHSGGEGTDAALKIEPDRELDPMRDGSNQVYFFGGFISLSQDRAIWMHTNDYPNEPHPIRHIKYCQFQVHAQTPSGWDDYEPPTSSSICLAGVEQSSFVNSNLRGCGPGTSVIELTASPETGAPTRNAFILGCDFSGPTEHATGLSLDAGTQRARLIGNTFGHHANIDHAIDWGSGEYDIVATANSFDTEKRTFRGRPPNNEAGASVVGTDSIDLGMAETWHDGRLDRRLSGTRTIQQGNRKTVPQGHDWSVVSGDPRAERGSLVLPAATDSNHAVVGPQTPFYVSSGTISLDVQWQASPSRGGLTFEFFAAGDGAHWQLCWEQDGTLALQKSRSDGGSEPVITTRLSIDEGWHTIGAERAPDGTWTLLADGDAPDSATDGFLPLTGGEADTMVIASSADAELRCRDLLVY